MTPGEFLRVVAVSRTIAAGVVAAAESFRISEASDRESARAEFGRVVAESGVAADRAAVLAVAVERELYRLAEPLAVAGKAAERLIEMLDKMTEEMAQAGSRED